MSPRHLSFVIRHYSGCYSSFFEPSSIILCKYQILMSEDFNNKNDDFPKLNPLENSVGDYIKLLLMLEGKVNSEHEVVRREASLWENLAPSILNLPASDLNVAAFLLTLEKKHKKAARYYSDLVNKYTQSEFDQTGTDSDSNVYKIVENLLDETNKDIHPDNEVQKYFEDEPYAFTAGILCEDHYKFIPDKSLLNLVQENARKRMALLMTQEQLKAEDFYRSKGIYGREISSGVLYHCIQITNNKLRMTDNVDTSLVGALHAKPSDRVGLFKQYRLVKKAVRQDIKAGILQLPERRLFRLNSLRKKNYASRELKNVFLNEDDFSQNKLLKILALYNENLKKVSDKIFPMTVVKDPISGKILRIQLSHKGIKIVEVKEIDIPKLSIIQDDEVEKHIRTLIAKNLADNRNISIEKIVKRVLSRKNLDSRTVEKIVESSVKSSVYSANTWGRKMLFWMKNYNPEKTVIGNLISSLVAQSFLPASVKENIDKVSNVPGLPFFATVYALAFISLPVAILFCVGFGGYYYVSNKMNPEILLARGILKGTKLFTKKDIETFDLSGNDPYFELTKLLFYGNNSVRNTFGLLLYQGDVRNTFVKNISNSFYKFENALSSSFSFLKDSAIVALGKIGFNTQYIHAVRKSRESVEAIKTILASNLNSEKRSQSKDLLGLISQNTNVFGFFRSSFASKMLEAIDIRKSKAVLNPLGFLKNTFSPNFTNMPGESWIYSWTGRAVQKSGAAVLSTLGAAVQNNGGVILNNLAIGTGKISAQASDSVFAADKNRINKATSLLTLMVGALAAFSVFSTILIAPHIIALRGGGGSPILVSSDVLCPNGSCASTNPNSATGVCPIQGPIVCSQSSYTNSSHANLNAIDIHNGPDTTQLTPVRAIVDGKLRIGQKACDGQEILYLVSNDGSVTYQFLHTMNPLPPERRNNVKQGDTIAYINNGPYTGCTTGKHLHVEVFYYDNNKQIFVNPLLRALNSWGCNITKKASGSYCEGGDYLKEP
jgi:murein DD-endopeptidase MepM/ murein hydrolase activator NlpD